MIKKLPHETKQLYLTDGGLETTLFFIEGIALPHFAACDLLFSDEGTQQIRAYFRSYAEMAKNKGVGFIIESPTWRANPSWGEALGYDDKKLAEANIKAIELCKEIREQYQTIDSPMPISGNIGPKGDGYVPGETMTDLEAKDFHLTQITILKEAGVDFVSAFTMNYVEEAIGVALAAQALDIPVVISFTVETDGKLATGMSLEEAINLVDKTTGQYPIYYMVNCAHPTHFNFTLKGASAWQDRIGGIRANASCKSHAELDNSTEIDEGDIVALGSHYHELLTELRNVNVLGGCCGTNHKHIDHIHLACQHHFSYC